MPLSSLNVIANKNPSPPYFSLALPFSSLFVMQNQNLILQTFLYRIAPLSHLKPLSFSLYMQFLQKTLTHCPPSLRETQTYKTLTLPWLVQRKTEWRYWFNYEVLGICLQYWLRIWLDYCFTWIICLKFACIIRFALIVGLKFA